MIELTRKRTSNLIPGRGGDLETVTAYVWIYFQYKIQKCVLLVYCWCCTIV